MFNFDEQHDVHHRRHDNFGKIVVFLFWTFARFFSSILCTYWNCITRTPEAAYFATCFINTFMMDIYEAIGLLAASGLDWKRKDEKDTKGYEMAV
ncbi:hypothetical protein F5Y14DRAFT_212315 [Nemania sp. NC0429]|nr:hypothetical protein F5Y14DRAFT_212315 [Nemania sp. NC0429]